MRDVEIADWKGLTVTVSNHYRWVALVCAVVFQASTFALLTFCFAFWVQPWMAEFEVGITQVMFIMTSVMLVIGTCSALVGRFFDRYPANIIVGLGIVVFAGGLWLGSYAQSYAQMFLIYGILLPVATSLTGTLASQSVTVKWFTGHGQLGLAIGIAAMGISVGGILLPPLVEASVTENDWRWVFRRASLLLGLGLAPLMFLLLMPRPPAVTFDDSDEADTPETNEAGKASIPLKDLLTNKYFLIPILAFFLDGVAYQGFQTNSKVYLDSIGVAGGAGAIISMLATTMLIAKLIMGKLTDWLHYRTLFILAALCNCAGLLIFALAIPSLIGVGVVLLGLGAGGLIPLQAKIIAFHFGASHFAQVFGFFVFLQMVGVLGSPLLSALYEAFGSYREPFFIMIGFVVVAMVLMLSLKKGRSVEPAAAG